MILVTNHGFVVHFNHDYIFQPNSVDLACCIVIDKGILTFQADVGTNSAHSICIRRKERGVLLPVANIIPAKIGGDKDKDFWPLPDNGIRGNKGWKPSGILDL